jgi:hypothetical protein
MPYKLSWEPSGVYRQYFGDVSIAERRASFDAICSNPRFDNIKFAITDYLSVGEYEVTKNSTEEIAAMHIGPLKTNDRIVMAAVAVRPDIIAAIHEFIGHSFTTAPYRIFSSVDEAREWIRSESVPTMR